MKFPSGYLELVGASLVDTVAIDKCPMRRSYALFALPVGSYRYGQSEPTTKTWLQTNVLHAGMLPAPCDFVAYRLNVLFLQKGRPLRLYESSLYAKTEIQFSVNARSWWDGPAWRCASPYALFETPEAAIPQVESRHGIRWAEIGGTLGYERWVREPNPGRPAGNFAGDNEDFAAKLKKKASPGVLIRVCENFGVRARVYDEGPQTDLELAVHLDGIQSRPIV